MKLGSIVRIAQALGVATTDLVPGLDARPERPLLKPRATR